MEFGPSPREQIVAAVNAATPGSYIEIDVPFNG